MIWSKNIPTNVPFMMVMMLRI